MSRPIRARRQAWGDVVPVPAHRQQTGERPAASGRVPAAAGLVVLLLAGCAPSAGGGSQPSPAAAPDSASTASAAATRDSVTAVAQRPTPQRAASRDSAARDSASQLVPAGYGTLRQDDIALRVSQLGLQVRAIPLDESVIRVLSPDSYRALHELVASQRERIGDVQRRTGLQRLSLWYVSFFGVEQGETRFSPMEFIITNVGRDFRPLDVVPLSPGFGLQRLRQREVQHGLYVFDGQVDVNQPLVIAYETARNSEWAVVLQRVERERTLVRSRAGSKPGT